MSYTTVNINTPPPYLCLSRSERLPTVMTVAGSDSSGGAGIEADLKTITAHRCYAQTCITALTAQTPVSVYNIHLTPKETLRSILDVNLKDMECDVIKTGMLTVDAIEVLDEKIKELDYSTRPKMVIDPVLVATSGSPLASDELVTLIKERITHLATLLTPNIPECFKLIGEERTIESLEDIFALAKDVKEACKCTNVLVKGGHIPWKKNSNKFITDVLLLGEEKKFIVYRGNYVETTNTHGTGCTLASAIASNLARGCSLPQAVYGGIEYVQNSVTIGCEVTKYHVNDNGPINHVYAIEIPLEKMIRDECFSAEEIISNNDSRILTGLPVIKGDFNDYLINHPKVKPHWDSYVNHEFVKKIADGSLACSKFRFFIEQDYSYLVDYGRIHCVVASKIPSLEDMEKELTIVGGVKDEMNHHIKRLKEDFGIKDDTYFENISRGPALKAYSRYFTDVAKRGNWQELITSLTPCLMGYGYALINVEDNITTTDNVYLDWLSVYSSKWYRKAMEEGRQLMNHVLDTYPTEQIESLVTIYSEVCELETKFWDAALSYEDK